jgi:hypothetical protein
MPDQSGTLETIAKSLALLLQPLEDRVTSGDIRLLLAELGLQFPASIEANGNLINATTLAVQRLKDLPPLVSALASAIQAEDVPKIIAKGLELANAIAVFVQNAESIAAALKASGAGGGITQPELNQFADELPGRLIDYLIVRDLEAVPGAAEALDFIGFVERTSVLAVDAAHPGFVRRRLHFDALTDFFQDPAQHLKTMYQWGDPGFNGVALLQKLQKLLTLAGLPAILDTTGAVPVLDVLFFELSPKADVNPPGLVLNIAHKLGVDNALPFSQDDWQFRLVLATQLSVGTQIVFQPTDDVTFIPPAATRVEGDLFLEWTGGTPSGEAYLILGEPGGSRLQAQQLVARAGVGLAWDSANNRARGVFKISGEVKNGKLVISLANADGFLGKILSGFGLESDFSVGLGFSTKEGIFFQGSATLDIQLPIHISLGPVEISALTVTVGIQDSTFPIGLAADIKAMLGPLQAVVQQIGIKAELSIPADRHGNAGPVNFDIKFKPPTGVGLAIDAGVIKGGGFLFIDPDRGEYAGALELTFSEIVSLKAIGLITTKMPDGSKGFSLLIIITAEFGTGIQLGFGFTLLAVGGLLGLNRTMKLQPLMDGIRTGAVESIMFPHDVVANAPKIISDLRIIFPPLEGKFLIGPMAKLGWGTPTLISISLGIIIEIPGNIAILGILKIAIPADEIALIILQVNFAGAIEFDRKRLYFFAALFESRIVFLTIEGEMGLLVAFGDDANFVVSVGGFHPRFSPPPLPFPSPKRIAVSLLNTPVSRLRIEGYFAVTSNTVQFGARVDVFFGLDEINVQGHLQFDALFQFSPFFFIIEISASFSVNVFGLGLFSVSVRGSLDGPAPYHVKGHGSISFFFFDVDVDFETTWGESRNTELPSIPVMPILEGEINKSDNWRALLPAANNLLVSLRKMPAEEAALILHPLGVLHISQRALPLELKLDKVGTQKPNDVNRLSVAVTGGGLAKKDDAFEQFAPAQYQNFSDADKLSRPAFAPEKSGLNLSAAGADVRSSVMVKRIVRYEEIIIDNNFKRFQRRFRGIFGTLFTLLLDGNAVSRSQLSQSTKKRLQPFAEKIEVKTETYIVALQSNNRAFAADSVLFHSEASARDYMNRKVADDASLADEIHVIPSFERVA